MPNTTFITKAIFVHHVGALIVKEKKMVLESNSILAVLYMKDNGKTIKKMVLQNVSMQMVKFMKDIFSMIKKMDKENLFF